MLALKLGVQRLQQQPLPLRSLHQQLTQDNYVKIYLENKWNLSEMISESHALTANAIISQTAKCGFSPAAQEEWLEHLLIDMLVAGQYFFTVIKQRNASN